MLWFWFRPFRIKRGKCPIRPCCLGFLLTLASDDLASCLEALRPCRYFFYASIVLVAELNGRVFNFFLEHAPL